MNSSMLFGVALAVLGCSGASALAADKPSSMTISTASPGGVYAVYGEGLAALISDVVGIPTSTRQTQGPSQNLVLVQSGQTELGLVTTGPAFEAVTGVLDLKPGDKHEDVRALFSMYPTPFQMVASADKGITKLSDLDGKRVGAGPKAGTGGVYWPRWLESLGIKSTLQFGGIGDQASQLADGRLDAIVTAGGIPHPSLSELETTSKVVIFGMDNATLQKLMGTNPYAVEFEIPVGTYRTVAQPLKTAAMWNFVVTRADLPDDVAYAIVKAVFDNHARMVTTHVAAKDTLAENVGKNTVVPLHPGALRYYREAGIAVPDSILPPGAK